MRVAIVAAMVGALVGAAVVFLTAPESLPAATVEASTPPVPIAAATTTDDGELSVLRRKIRRLEHRIEALESTRREVARAGGAGKRASVETDAIRAGSEIAAAGGLIEETGEVAPEVRDAVQDAVRDEIEAEREARWERRRARMETRTRERVEAFAEEVELTDDQMGRLLGALETEQEQVFSNFRRAREEMNWEEAREKARAIREQTDAEVGEYLDEDQIAGWRKLREEEGPGGFRGRRGGR